MSHKLVQAITGEQAITRNNLSGWKLENVESYKTQEVIIGDEVAIVTHKVANEYGFPSSKVPAITKEDRRGNWVVEMKNKSATVEVVIGDELAVVTKKLAQEYGFQTPQQVAFSPVIDELKKRNSQNEIDAASDATSSASLSLKILSAVAVTAGLIAIILATAAVCASFGGMLAPVALGLAGIGLASAGFFGLAKLNEEAPEVVLTDAPAELPAPGVA